ncbi:NAD-dependent malic enzyme [Candidatus Uhrbacteria bacterium]|nr:NAD-dependent malic enzyme [Candidatus Uhrbacteria bacterium]MBD3284492.1 NAD-dependent malic enzyme [Candidatus Uhrbacteria bacterium]
MSNQHISVAEEAIALHAKRRGKIEVTSTTEVKDGKDLSLVYTPGVGAVSSAIAEDPSRADELTWIRNTVAIVSDGSAVLGLGNIGPRAALPVMEGKSVIFKEFTNINAIPIVLDTQDTEEIIAVTKAIAPTFGAIQLEDISAPRCFEIEERLSKELDMPVFHDDQHGTAVVAMAGLLNAVKIVGKDLKTCRIVLSGAGAAGIAIAKLLHAYGVEELILVDSQGAIWNGRPGLNPFKQELSAYTNPKKLQGELKDVIEGADIFIGISKPGIVTKAMILSMIQDPIIFALSNPVPEIMPEEAKEAGVRVIATGRSDFPNQVNNALCYPGLFRGMLDSGVKQVDDAIKLRAATAIASFVDMPTPERFIPTLFDEGLHEAVARSVVSK